KFFRYFQLQPAFWRIDYLIGVCRAAMARGITDPWTFEAMRLDDAEPHYVAAYDWPSVHHGFIAQGKINPAAISFMSRRAAPELHRQLICARVGCYSPTLNTVRRAAELGWDRLAHLGAVLATRVQARTT